MAHTDTQLGRLGRGRLEIVRPQSCRHEARALPGELIADRYRVTALLGQGGMGTVYAVVDLTNGRELALKRTSRTASARIRELFKREFHTLRGLRHPNIIEVYDYGGDGAGLFYTMELLLRGSDLGKAPPLPWRVVCQHLRQLAAALGLLHARRLLHRDISPRNVWVFPDGRLKLIDFGALSPFGVPTEVVGTLPMLAPEWLLDGSLGRVVDQRADLYSLGALGYWLLTARHAYRVGSERDVPQCWAEAPPAPSALLEEREIPAELDALILSLLRTDVAARLDSTERLIDRLDAIAGPTGAPPDQGIHGYLRSRAFVGRSRELQRFRCWLADPYLRHSAFVVEGESGLGRSALLEEFSVVASVAGAVSVLVSGEKCELPYALAGAIAQGLCQQLPAEARNVAADQADLLARISPALRDDLGLATADTAALAPSEKQEIAEALTRWLHALARERQIAILIDDIELADDESFAWLAALSASTCGDVQLVVALRREPRAAPTLPVQMLCRGAEPISLSFLTASDVEELLRSVFGPVEYLGRVANVVYRASQGNPAHCIELLEHLIERGVARHVDGAWILPGELCDAQLPRSRVELHLARFRRLSEKAQELARQLSVHDGAIKRSHCSALSNSSESETSAALVELVLQGVLIRDEAGYSFEHSAVREQAYAALTPKQRRSAHSRLAAALLAEQPDPVDTLRAGLQHMRAGHPRRARRLVARAAWELLQDYSAMARTFGAVALLEQALAFFPRSNRVVAPVLSALAVASYTTDSRLADRYGKITLSTLEDLLQLGWARALRRLIGPKPALYVALVASGIRTRGSVRKLLHMLASSALFFNAVAATCMRRDLAERSAHALEPLAVLGEFHIAGLYYRGVRAVGAILRGVYFESLTELRSLCAVLQSDTPIRNMPDQLRRDCAIGYLLPIGTLECWRMSEDVPAIAARTESLELEGVTAEYMRAMYYAMRGEKARAAESRRRLETRALQPGGASHILTLVPLDANWTAHWTHDALLGKRAAVELERLSREFPCLRYQACRARATYLVLCGRHREAIETMQADDAFQDPLGWAHGQGVLARAHNRLGEHARARDVCLHALEDRSQNDLDFVVMFLHVQLELAVSEAALGAHDSARGRVENLLTRYRERIGPLLLGAIYEAAGRVALLAGERERARSHCEAMRRCVAFTESATLLELAEQFDDQLEAAHPSRPPRTRDRGQRDNFISRLGDDADLITRTYLSKSADADTWAERARRGLRLAQELTEAPTGFVLSSFVGQEVIRLEGHDPDPRVVQWADTVRTEGSSLAIDLLLEPKLVYTATLNRNDTRYCMFPLDCMDGLARTPAVLVLGFPARDARIPDHDMLVQLARSLRAMLTSSV